MSVVDFGSLFTFIRNGKNVRQQEGAGGIPISRIETISQGKIDPLRVGFAGLGEDAVDGWLLEVGDILFSHINSVEHVGKCALYEGVPSQLVHGMNLLCLRPNRSQITPSFAMKLIRTPEFRSKLSNFINKAVNQASVSTTNLKGIKVAVPPLDEQRRIAAILDQAEALRTKRRQALAKLDTLTQSLFLEMFGDPERDSRWKCTQLGILIVDGPQNGLYRHSEDYGSGTPILRIDAFYDGLVTSLASLKRLRLSEQDVHRFSLTEGDLVINRVNSIEYLGKSAIIPRLDEATVFESNMMRFRVDSERMNSTFLIHLLQTAFIRRQILSCAKDAVNQSSINQKDVSSLRVVVPPLSLQNEFSQRALAIVQNGHVLKTAAKAMNTLFASLQHRAFHGEL